MRILANQLDFEFPASVLPRGYVAIGSLGSAELEECAMRILWFSRIQRAYVSVSLRDLERQWNDPTDEASLIKAVGGITRLRACLRILVDSNTILELGDGEYAPTPELVLAIKQSRQSIKECN